MLFRSLTQQLARDDFAARLPGTHHQEHQTAEGQRKPAAGGNLLRVGHEEGDVDQGQRQTDRSDD